MLPMGLGYVEGVTHDYLRHGTTTLFAALDSARGTVLTQCRKRHRHQEYLDFLREIDKNVPTQLDVHIIVDNYATHKHARGSSVGWPSDRASRCTSRTTYASWLNQVRFGLTGSLSKLSAAEASAACENLWRRSIPSCSIPTPAHAPSSGRPRRIRSSLKCNDYVSVFPGR
jgi:transposase